MNISKDISSSSTLPGSFYNSPSELEKLKTSVFEKSWQIITENESVKIPGTVFPFSFMDGFIEEPLLLTRNKQDELFCFSNVCTHRGNILVEHPCQLNGTINCSYHGRRFNMDGKFISMPETEGMKNFPCKDDDLTQLTVKNWKQFIFTSMNPYFSFEELIKEMDKRVGWMPIENFIFDSNRSKEYLVKANWALYCDNYLEGFHIPYIHRDLAKSLDYSLYSSEIYPYSNLQLGVARNGEMCFDLPESSPDYGKNIAAFYYWLFPNIMFNFYPWGLSLNIVRPLKHNLTKVIFKSYVWDESKIDAGAGALLDRVEREDEDMVERVQIGTKAKLYTKGRFSPKMEQGVHHFHLLLQSFINDNK